MATLAAKRIRPRTKDHEPRRKNREPLLSSCGDVARELIEGRHLAWIRFFARKIVRVTPPDLPVTLDDLIHVGIIAFLEAYPRFESARSNDTGDHKNVYHFLKRRVHGAMIDELRRIDPLDNRTRRRVNTLERESWKYANKIGHYPSIEELAVHVSMDQQTVEDAFCIAQMVRAIS